MSITSETMSFSLGVNAKGGKELRPCAPGVQSPILKKGHRPSKRAVHLANALMVERMLHDATFPSVEAAMRALGITRMMRTRLFRALDMSPEEMARVLAETY